MKLKYAIGICLGVFLAGWGLISSVVAHPHIWIMAKSFVIFNSEGKVATLRHQFTFDKAFSAWAVQGLDTDGDGEVSSVELSELTEGYLDGLSQYGFYTFAGTGTQDATVVLGDQAFITDGPDGLTLDFELDLQTPVDADQGFDVAVLDQEYYVAIEFVETNPVELVNPPASCRSSLKPPTELDPEIQEKLFAIGPDVTQLPADLKVAVRDASTKIRVVCGEAPGVEAVSAIEAAADMATTPPARPFGGPAVERGLPVPRDGILGWIYQQQQDFYRALTAALSALQTENQAIWVLGTLSFLYGVFHAAGPGHGKLVISSYVLATERQLSRGVAMSFASAFVQALVAIGFVLIAALALRMTSVAMSGASQWLIVGSYAMVAALGAWLMLRHIMGWGHSHNRDHDHDHHEHAHDHGHEHEHAHHAEHDHGHDHVHNVTPEQTSGNFWEMAGVIVSVGMRPCSGALVVLVFSLSQGLLLAGIISTLLMALGTGITVAVLASFAVFFKGLLARNTSGAAWVGKLLWWLELLGAALVLAFGVMFLLANI